MAQIVINEISQNYTYNIGANSFATVALPITAAWGPGYIEEPGSTDEAKGIVLEDTMWTRFPATQQGLEAFISTYRGPVSNYRLSEDYSYQQAVTLITSGYDVLVCRLSNGDKSSNKFAFYKDEKTDDEYGYLQIKAKYPGSFGNNIVCNLYKKNQYGMNYWNLIVYAKNSNGTKTAVENLVFVLEKNDATDNILYYEEIESNFINMIFNITDSTKEPGTGNIDKDSYISGDILKGETKIKIDTTAMCTLKSGSDYPSYNGSASTHIESAITYAKSRYTDALSESEVANNTYIKALSDIQAQLGEDSSKLSNTEAGIIRDNEWKYTAAYNVYDLLKDKLNYNPQRIISPWDDQNFCALENTGGEKHTTVCNISPLHIKIMEVAFYSRCATGMLDIPYSLSRSAVYNESSDATNEGYAQKLARFKPEVAGIDTSLYATHSALFAPWSKYQYVGTSRPCKASPSFVALLLQRAMLLNQTTQYEWALPTNRRHNLNIGKLDYKVPKSVLDEWQKLEGVGVNAITEIPDLGTNIWGNSTLYEVPPATYQALANLSTRYLMNAVKDVIYKCGLSITFQYNNEQAYNKFYAGVTPTLDTMKNVGAIDGYVVKMSADINGLDQVNANTIIGTVWLSVAGVINDIVVDLVALPQGTDLSQFNS